MFGKDPNTLGLTSADSPLAQKRSVRGDREHEMAKRHAAKHKKKKKTHLIRQPKDRY